MTTPFPDLLASTPTARLPARRVKQALAFAFANGVPESTWSAFFADAVLPPSSWDPSTFARELFVPELAASCAAARVDGEAFALDAAWLTRVLSRPPDDDGDVALRRGIVAELAASEEARADLGRVYAALRRLRTRLEVAPIRHAELLRRRIDVLESARAAFDALASSFEGAGSALGRVRAYGEAVRASEGYRALVDLLEYDDHLGTVDVRVRVGADGRVRGVALGRVRENRGNPLAMSPLGRWLARLALLVRGYRFGAEEILARAIEKVFDGIEDDLVRLTQLTGDLEVYLAALSFRAAAERAGLAVCIPDLTAFDASGGAGGGAGGAGGRTMRALYNPLLVAQEPHIVPCDVELDRDDALVLLTGPNSGGKTRLLQAVGIAQLLAQGGFFVPAREARIPRARGIFVSLGEPPAADASEGRLGTELLRVRTLFERLPPSGLVLMDELCSGTNPSEGEELFRLVLELLVELRPQGFLSTHFLDLAARMQGDPPSAALRFLQVELDADEQPTYRFARGVATTSLARRTAARLGVTREDLLRLVRRAREAPR